MAGKIPYPAVDPTSLLMTLESGQKVQKPNIHCLDSRNVSPSAGAGLIIKCTVDDRSYYTYIHSYAIMWKC